MLALANDNTTVAQPMGPVRDEIHEIVLELVFSCQSQIPLGMVSTLVDTAVERVMKVTGA
jgi:hypothetical protein